MMAGPLARYRAALGQGTLSPDPAQALTVEKLQSLHNALRHYEPATGAAGWKARFGLARRRAEPPQGLYLYGGVGRGKSMLMDMFFQGAPVERKRRVHFHGFMQQVHGRLGEYRKWKGRDAGDPIPPVAGRLAAEARLLCFDELMVQDIADAMILGRLFRVLFEAGVVMVATSNRPPRELYKDGLQRSLFVPFIDLIERKLDVLALDGEVDYRQRTLRSLDTYLTPLGDATDQRLWQAFQRLTLGAPAGPEVLRVGGRALEVPVAAAGVARFDFAELCERPLGPADYLALAARYHTVVVAGIPRMGPEKRNEAKRFTTLVDALYDGGVNLVCSAAAAPEALYPQGDGAFEFRRTASRLAEMGGGRRPGEAGVGTILQPLRPGGAPPG